MKNFFFIILVIGLHSISIAQIKNPVTWTYSAKKIADKKYEVHITAAIEHGWHIYSLDHKAETGIATSVNFNINPLATTDGKLEAKGKIVKMKDPYGTEIVKFYEKSVDIVQVFKLKSDVKTNISGSIEFMTCDDKQCLPPARKQFSVSLQ